MGKILNALKREMDGFLKFFILNAPNTFLGFNVRKYYYINKFINAKTCKFCLGFEVLTPDNTGWKLLNIGKNIVFGANVKIGVGPHGSIYIGDDTGIAEGTYIRTDNHVIDSIDIPFSKQGHECKYIPYTDGKQYSIIIENDVWIGAHCIILPGAYIGKGSVIAAGSVVSNFIPPYSIAVGNPARVVADRQKRKQKEK